MHLRKISLWKVHQSKRQPQYTPCNRTLCIESIAKRCITRNREISYIDRIGFLKLCDRRIAWEIIDHFHRVHYLARAVTREEVWDLCSTLFQTLFAPFEQSLSRINPHSTYVNRHLVCASFIHVHQLIEHDDRCYKDRQSKHHRVRHAVHIVRDNTCDDAECKTVKSFWHLESRLFVL